MKFQLCILMILLLSSCNLFHSESNENLYIKFSAEETTNEEKLVIAEKVIKNGNNFPPFSLINEKDQLLTQEGFSEGDVFYMFWSTWCASCIDNIVAVRDLRKKGLLENIKFVSISTNEEPDKWKRFIEQYDMDDYMDNILLGQGKKHILNSFIFQGGQRISEQGVPSGKMLYASIVPAYCHVKDGKIIDNSPEILPKNKQEFLEIYN